MVWEAGLFAACGMAIWRPTAIPLRFRRRTVSPSSRYTRWTRFQLARTRIFPCLSTIRGSQSRYIKQNETILRLPRPTAEPSFGHGVQRDTLRSFLISAWVAAFLLFASATTAHSTTFVLRYDAIGATGGFVGGTTLGMTAGQPAIGVATAAGGAITETAGFWHPRAGAPVTGVSEPSGALTFALMPIVPNPAVRNAKIRYIIPGSAGAGLEASVRVFDVSGRLVRVLAAGPHAPGAHTVTWDGLNSAGGRLGAGTFFVELAAGSHRSVRRVILLR